MATTLYVPDRSLDPAWLVDMDGTLALGHFGEAGRRAPFDWHRVGEDDPHPAIVELVQCLADHYAVVVMSGRDAVCRQATADWLDYHEIKYRQLHMRAVGDWRPDALVKRELFDALVAPSWWVQGVLDDRDQVVNMWRSLGLTCLQVAPGDF